MMDSNSLLLILSLVSSLFFLAFSCVWFFSVKAKRKRADNADKAEAANAANAIKTEYEKIMDTHKPIFALLAYLSDHGRGSMAAIPSKVGGHLNILFYNDKISILSQIESIVQINLPVNLITSYYINSGHLRFYFKDSDVSHREYPNDNYVDFLIKNFAFDTAVENFNKYALTQIDYFAYLSENFEKVPDKVITINI